MRELPVSRNSFFGLLGFGVPVVVVLAAYPILLHALGMKTLGIYLLATSMSGALAFLDAGFSGATLKFVAEDLANGRKFEAARILMASTIFYGSVGAAGALVLWLLSPWLVSIFGIDAAMRPVALTSFRLASLQFGVFFTLTVFISLFKGMNRFDLSTLSLSLLSVLTYGGAVAVVRFAHAGLVGVTAAGLGANVFVLALAAAMGLRVCLREGLPLAHARPTLATYRRMFAFGSFMTINGLAGLLLLQIQRYLIGIQLGPAAVAVYQTASVPPSKIHAAVNASTEVLFPMASASRDPLRLRHLYLQMLGATIAFAALAFFPLVFFGSRVLSFWLGRQSPPELEPLIVIFAIAYFFQAITPPPYHLLNGMGRPWINTLFFLLTAMLNVSFIAIAVFSGVSLVKVAWAFAAAMIITVAAYHLTVEFYVWRRLQSAELAVTT